MNKKGISGIVVTVLLVLLVIGALGILWIILLSFINSSGDQISKGINLINLDIIDGSASYNLDNNKLQLKISRNNNEGNLTGFRIIFYESGGNSEHIDFDTSIKVLETLNYNLDIPLGFEIDNPDKISIIPIVYKNNKKYVTSITDEEILKQAVQCQNDADCDDLNFCNGDETCNLETNICQQGTPVNCPNNDGVECTIETCNEAAHSCDTSINSAICISPQVCNPTLFPPPTGCGIVTSCTGQPNGNFCDDGNYCNGADVCQSGTCVNQININPCVDEISCTTNSCNEITDSCSFIPNNALCDNGGVCDGDEICNPASGCQDGPDPCTADSYSCTTTCIESVFGGYSCNYPDNTLCDDGNSCTTNTCIGVGGDVNGCSLTPSTSCLPKQSNIVLYLPFENGAVDLSGKNNPGVINGPVQSQGKSGKAYKFDGINDRIEFADDPDIRLSPLGYTLIAWVKMDGSNADTSDLGGGPLHIEVIINKLNTESSVLKGYNTECRLYAPEPNCLFSYSNGNANPFAARRATSTNIVNQNQWVMMTAVFNISHSTLYINGNKVNTTANVGFFSPSTSLPLWIGDDYTFQQRVWNGSIDEVMIYNVPLTDQEIQNIYNEFN